MSLDITKEDDYLTILNKNDPELLRRFLLSNGKKQKPISPIYFISKEVNNEECRINDTVDGSDQRSDDPSGYGWNAESR